MNLYKYKHVMKYKRLLFFSKAFSFMPYLKTYQKYLFILDFLKQNVAQAHAHSIEVIFLLDL